MAESKMSKSTGGELSEIRVWDPFVRVFHWLLLAGFAVAYISEGEPLVLHSWAGYLAAALIGLRLLWGFIGRGHARFADFVYPPRTVVAYLNDLVRGRARRYIGHSPAGGAMIIMLMFSVAATALTGMATLALDKNAGPLAPLLGRQAALSAPTGPSFVVVAYADEKPGKTDETQRPRRKRSAVKEAHEFFANLTVWLAFFHVAGVLFASFAHRENLVKAMVNGRKPVDHAPG